MEMEGAFVGKTILVIEDEQQIVEICRDYLTANGFEVASASDGIAGLKLAESIHPVLVLLDLMLPGMDGIEICRRLRLHSAVPIIILTARHREADKLEGLQTGADDYITKPFSPREMVARVQAVLRRTENHPESETEKATAIRLDRDHYRALLPAGEVSLTPTEFDILSILSSQPGEVFSRGQLLNLIRGVSFGSYERAIDSHIRNLRRKVDRDGDNKRHIITVHGYGYKYVE
ncbi:DNA-binding response regulator [Leptolinea sp. HRD-7]|nr:DNA-binding response regulator [Leptolinea sp. HRD-7]